MIGRELKAMNVTTFRPDQTEKIYDSLRRGKAKLVGPDGQSRALPGSLRSFLVTLTRLMSQGKDVYLVQDESKLSTIDAAGLLGVSRQFLVNLLEKGAIPYHMVGSHRRMYTQDLLRYKAERDAQRRKTLDDLVKAEAAEGIYDRIPASE
jgi:excisionase family DNA binding protein